MDLQVTNKELAVGSIRVTGVASSSVLIVGDTQVINLSSVFDTPPESLIIGPLVPLAAER
ncbi:spore gernimation protein GerPD [Paenibacillus allorhizosphaerae]|uniref:Spore germination protein GerPD n=1 Tax=Paenibacillus allorhizosphaerae TaxID=2849866 RepID=A0ABN7TG48_9BACL|nr:spore gernimation protein GerPD [Paenibacillus allorhizosphaerae]CAG7621761.1 putative spore germination protein GerPD [Paenibacillus allorhizosphaerae]